MVQGGVKMYQFNINITVVLIKCTFIRHNSLVVHILSQMHIFVTHEHKKHEQHLLWQAGLYEKWKAYLGKDFTVVKQIFIVYFKLRKIEYF